VDPGRKAVFRSSFELTAEQLDLGVGLLRFGPIDDSGVIYVNGREAGRTTDYSKPHELDVAKYLKPGSNAVAVVVAKRLAAPGGD